MAVDVGAALPNALPFPLGHVPTWAIVNADHPAELPLMGQFVPNVKRSRGEAIWSKRPAILGGKPWLKYVGKGNETLKFDFHAISNNILDLYPLTAWDKLNDLASVNSTLGRPPQVLFVYGLTIVRGYITAVAEAPIDYWPNTRTPREIGPLEVEITLVPGEEALVPLSTNYVVITDETTYEELARTQYDEPRYCPSLAEYNQGKAVGDVAEIPRKGNSAIVKIVDVCPYFAMDDNIEGL